MLTVVTKNALTSPKKKRKYIEKSCDSLISSCNFPYQRITPYLTHCKHLPPTVTLKMHWVKSICFANIISNLTWDKKNWLHASLGGFSSVAKFKSIEIIPNTIHTVSIERNNILNLNSFERAIRKILANMFYVAKLVRCQVLIYCSLLGKSTRNTHGLWKWAKLAKRMKRKIKTSYSYHS